MTDKQFEKASEIVASINDFKEVRSRLEGVSSFRVIGHNTEGIGVYDTPMEVALSSSFKDDRMDEIARQIFLLEDELDKI